MNLKNWLNKIFTVVVLGSLCINSFAQLQQMNVPLKQSFRGIDALNDSIVWCSGTNATYMYTENGGNTWVADSIKEAKGVDFRDIEIINDSTIYMVSAGSPGLIYKTTNKGKSWNLIMKDTRESVFIDGFDFWSNGDGIFYGDPIDNKFLCGKIVGDTIEVLNKLPDCIHHEAGFAASGTGIIAINDSLVWIATGGGEIARVYHSANKGASWQVFDTPLASGEATGIFSIVFWNDKEGVIVGGNYIDSTNNVANCAYTNNSGKSWELLNKNQPNGYRSCVASTTNGNILIACGRTGIDYSLDKGLTWQTFSSEGYYAVKISNKTVWFSGRKGKVAKVELDHFY